MTRASIGGHPVGEGHPLLVITGPCVIESEESVLRHARRVRELLGKRRARREQALGEARKAEVAKGLRHLKS